MVALGVVEHLALEGKQTSLRRLTRFIADVHVPISPRSQWLSNSAPLEVSSLNKKRKLGAVHLVHQWARRLPDGVEIVAYNPSLVVGTGLAREAGGALPFLMSKIIPLLAVTPLVDTPISAGSKLAELILGVTPAETGAYIHRKKAAASSAESYDVDRERELWEWLEKVPRSSL